MNFVVVQQLTHAINSYTALSVQAEEICALHRPALARIGLRHSYCQSASAQPQAVFIYDFWAQEADFRQHSTLLDRRDDSLRGSAKTLGSVGGFEMVKFHSREEFSLLTATAVVVQARELGLCGILTGALATLWDNPATNSLWLGRNVARPGQFLVHILWNEIGAAYAFVRQGGLALAAAPRLYQSKLSATLGSQSLYPFKSFRYAS